MADPIAPKGGFQTGGWYSGKQAWQDSGGNWTFSQRGQINPLSNQQGAGQQVSAEVVAQTSPANVQYLKQQQQPTTKEQVTPYLSDFQNGIYQSAQAPATKTVAELKTELAPTTAQPELLNRVEEFDKMRAEYGVADLETNLNDLKAQQDELYAELRTQRYTEEGKPVALGVISGRISEEERVYQERADYLGRQVSRITDELNTKYNVISTYMELKGLDYQDAVSAYDKEFAQNVQMYDLIAGERKEARSAYEYDQTAARANLQVYTNAIMSGNLSYADFSMDQKLMISKLEAQALLPIGFVGNLQMSPQDRLMAISGDKTQAWVIGKDGNLEVVQTGLRKSTGVDDMSEPERKRAAFSEIERKLRELGGEDLYVSPDEWKEVKSAWSTQDYGEEEFDAAFRNRFVNPDWDPYDYGLE